MGNEIRGRIMPTSEMDASLGIKSDIIQCAAIEIKESLDQISTMQYSSAEFSTEKNTELSTVAYPWRRHFARTLDLAAYALIWTAFSNLVFNLNLEKNPFIGIINSYISCGIMLILEPLILSRYGTTLGKWVLGLVIRDVGGGKLTYTQAWHRTFGVFGKGMGYNIPIVDILCGVNCYCECKDKTPMPWEKNTSYTIKDKKAVRIIAFIGVFLVICFISYLFTYKL